MAEGENEGKGKKILIIAGIVVVGIVLAVVLL